MPDCRLAKKSAGKKKETLYITPESSMALFGFEETSAYDENRFKVFFNDPLQSVWLLKGNCIEVLGRARENSVDMIFADPPYFLSNGGITCHAGKMVSVNKGKWDQSKGIKENHQFNLEWLAACQRVLKPNGTIWVSGTTHIIHSIGFAMQELGFKILNDVVWYKRNAPPNLSCRYFTHSTEIILWAAKDKKSKHHFDYKLMKQTNEGKQMRNVWGLDENKIPIWELSAPKPVEKKFGKHPTQKPIELLDRIVQASTKKGDLILDPFCGSSTTGVAAVLQNRRFIGIETEENFLELSKKRILSVLDSKKVELANECC